MGNRDAAEKTLESFADVFSDLMNVFLFEGETVVHEEDLREATPLHSVLTFVLYFGSERKRIRPRSLFETTQLVSALTGNTDIERRFAEDMKGAPE